MTTELQPVTCREPGCGQSFAVEVPADGEPYHDELLRMAQAGVLCNGCRDKKDLQAKASKILAAESARQSSWKTFCPAEFQKPIEWGHKNCSRQNYAKLMEWRYGAKGLLVSGDNGHCKTRFMWKLIEREWNLDRTMAAHSHAQWRITCSALAGADSARVVDWLAAQAKVELLFIDDLGKGRGTPASEEAFFSLMDARMNKQLPTLFTTDMKVGQIEATFSDDYNRGIMRRILDFTEHIEF